ncbi:MAG: KpsF/GutQ family protein [Gemmatimonadetes bacterium]|nr:KpsF/GutQ family protein [Gemmatimonadota bacterium]
MSAQVASTHPTVSATPVDSTSMPPPRDSVEADATLGSAARSIGPAIASEHAIDGSAGRIASNESVDAGEARASVKRGADGGAGETAEEGVAMTTAEMLERARRVIRQEAEAVAALEGRIGDDFARAVELMLEGRGRVIVSGIGKSGIIGRKIAATLTSTGTPATFLHPVEALHGDLGIVGPDDVAILLSKSGESEELHGLLESLGRVGVRVIALTGRLDSSLARQADAVLDCSVAQEACPHDLAPTTSTTAAMAMGDALAVALLLRRGFGREDFARFHPGGSLGRRLLLRVRDAMVSDGLPLLPPDATMRECLVLLAERRGTVAVVDGERRLLGVVTSGDLTRLMEREEHFFPVAVSTVMTNDPRTAEPDDLAAAAVGIMERHGIMALPVLDEARRVIAMVHLHDLMRAGAV